MKEKLSKLAGNNNTSRIVALVLSLLLCISIIGIIASAASVTKNGLEATLVTDKEEYSASEPIVATLSVENKGDKTIDEVNLETLIPDGYHIESTQIPTKDVTQLEIGEIAVLRVTLVPETSAPSDTPATPVIVTPETPSKNDEFSTKTDNDKQKDEQIDSSKTSSIKTTTRENEAGSLTATNTLSTKLTTPSTAKTTRTTSNSSSTALTNSSAKTMAETVYTGDDNTVWLWGTLACLSLVLILLVNRTKNSGTFKTLYSVILVFAVLSAIVGYSILEVSAADSPNTIELETNVAVGNEPITINSIVKYSLRSGQLDAYSTSQSDEIYYSATTFDDVVVRDAESAKKVIAAKSTEMGIEDIENELRLKDEPQTVTSKFYRFSQYFNNVPVLGRQVILKTDDNGKVQALVSNTHHIENVEDDGSLSQSEIQMIIEEEMNTPNTRITDEGYQTVIYDYGEDGPVYAYLLTVVSDISFNQLIIDKKSGEVLQNSPILKQEDAMLYNQTGSLSTLGWHDELGFHLANKQKNISVFDGATVFDGSPWKIPEKSVNTDFETYGLRIISHEDNIFGNEEIGILNDILYFSNYYSSLGDSTFDQIHVALNVDYNNASGGGGIESGKKKAIMMIGKPYSATMYDVIAHEYTHAVQGIIVGLNGDCNNKMPGAINEGVADIFGTLIESKIKNKAPDWIMGEEKDETTRNIANPTSGQSEECAFELLGKSCPIKSKHGKHRFDNSYKVSNDTCIIKLPYPDKFMGKYYYENRDEHPNSLVISHAAYLMWNGIDGSSQKKIAEDDLAQIWYDSLYLMNSDATFMQCANAVYLAAKTNKNLNKKQIECVQEAFDAVGLNYKGEYRVGKGSPFAVKNHQGDNLASFYLTIENENGDVVSKKQYSADQAYIYLDDGKYVFKIKKTEDDTVEYEFAITVSGLETYTLNLHTLIEGQNGAFSIDGIDDPEPSQGNNGHYYKVFDDDLTWDEAKTICESYGGHLVSITSQKENDIVSDLIKNVSMGAYWIGAQRDDNWKWITGEDFTYSSWQPNRPDNNEQGMVIQIFNNNVYENQLGLWDDTWTDGDHAAGLREQGYVCEWDSKQAYDNGFGFASGSGTEEDPYVIETVNQLKNMSTFMYAKDEQVPYFVLNNDLDLNGEDWIPLGNLHQGDIYCNFDGHNHTISNLLLSETSIENYINKYGDNYKHSFDCPKYLGLFGELMHSSITNLNLSNVRIKLDLGKVMHNHYERLINSFAYNLNNPYYLNDVSAGFLAADADADVSNCSVSGAITITNSNAPGFKEYYSGFSFGGLCNGGGRFNNCKTNLSVSATNHVFPDYTDSITYDREIDLCISGLAGTCQYANDCHVSAEMTVNGYFRSFSEYGLVDTPFGVINNCSAYVNADNSIYSGMASIGGLIGYSAIDDMWLSNSKFFGSIKIDNHEQASNDIWNGGYVADGVKCLVKRIAAIPQDILEDNEECEYLKNNSSDATINGVYPNVDIGHNKKNGATI